MSNNTADIYVLLNDLDLSFLTNYTPNSFNSTFNGNGHIIKNLVITTP